LLQCMSPEVADFVAEVADQAGINRKASPPTNPATMHVSTTRSNMRRKISLSRNCSLRARENVE